MGSTTGLFGAGVWILLLGAAGLAGAGRSVFVAVAAGIALHAAFRHRRNVLVALFLYSQLLFPLEYWGTLALGLDYYFRIEDAQIGNFFLAQALSLLPLLVIRESEPLDIGAFRIESFGSVWFVILVTAGMVAAVALFAIKGTMLLGTGEGDFSTYVDNLEQNSGAIEYALIPLAILSLAVAVSRRGYVILGVVSLLFILKCLSFGFRVQGMTAALIVFVVFFRNLKPAVVPLLFVGGVLFGLLVGVLKFSTEFSFNELFIQGDEFMQTTQSGVLVSSTIALQYMDFSLDRLIALPFAFVLPPSVLRSYLLELYPMVYIQETYASPGGLSFGIYGHVFAGWVGVLLVGVAVAYFASLLNRRARSISPTVLFAAFIFFVFFPRWSLYEFGNYGLRMAIWGVIFFIGLRAAARIVSGRAL